MIMKKNTSHLAQLAKKDIVLGMKMWRIWLLLGFQDIKLRYRRSKLGPFWITISTGLMIYSMGFLYAHLFKIDLSHYYIFLASGMVTWTLISTIMLEATDTFMESQSYIKQIKLPYTIYIMRILTRNFIIFLHNIIAIVPIMIYFHILPHLLSLLFGLLVIGLCALTYGTILAIIGTRYRDIKQIIHSLVQIIFLLTPIMWQPDMLPEKYKLLTHLNPFMQLIELLRSSMMGHPPATANFLSCIVIVLIGVLIAFVLFMRARHRIAFWV